MQAVWVYTIPVSYTHLDVYKRQPLVYGENTFVIRYNNETDKDINRIRVNLVGKDVYKRQDIRNIILCINVFPS